MESRIQNESLIALSAVRVWVAVCARSALIASLRAVLAPSAVGVKPLTDRAAQALIGSIVIVSS